MIPTEIGPKVGDAVKVTVLRQDKRVDVAVTLQPGA
jgi:S-adenosylmethionine synthetase